MRIFILSILLTFSISGWAGSYEHINRIMNTGDGKSPDTAFEVYSIDEQYQILHYLKIKPNMQMLQAIDGEHFDIFQVNGEYIFFKIVEKPEPLAS